MMEDKKDTKELQFYFQEAKQWYAEKCLVNFQFVGIFIIIIIINTISLMSIFNIYQSLFPLQEKAELIAFTDRNPSSNVYITQFDKSYPTREMWFIAEIIKNYIQEFEAIECEDGADCYAELERKLHIAQNIFSKNAYMEFQKEQKNVRNQYSITYSFLTKHKQTVKIDKLIFNTEQSVIDNIQNLFLDPETPNSATVTIETTVNQIRKQKFRIDVKYDFDIQAQFDGTPKIIFTFTQYTKTQI